MMERDLRFAAIAKNIQVNAATLRYELANTSIPQKKYVIFFVARSGSTWLTSILSATQILGFPDEYLNPEFIPEEIQSLNAANPVDFLRVLQRRNQSPNGIFGIEVQADHVDLFGPDEFFRAFSQRTVFFNLWRDNIVAQAISLYRAIATGRFHSSDQAQAAPPVYDAEGIRRWLEHLLDTENGNLAMLNARGLPFHNLQYETMVRDRLGTIRRFATALGVPFDPAQFSAPPRGELQKIGDDWNQEAEHRFRQDNAAYLAAMEARRAIKKAAPA